MSRVLILILFLVSLEARARSCREIFHTQLREIDLRETKLKSFDFIARNRYRKGGFQYQIRKRDDKIEAPQRGSIEDFIRTAPRLALRLGLKLYNRILTFEDVRALNRRIQKLRRENPEIAPLFTVYWDHSLTGIDPVTYLRNLTEWRIPISRRGVDKIVGDLMTHDLRVHTFKFLTLPKSIAQVMVERARTRVAFYDLAVKLGSPYLIEQALAEIRTETGRIDGFTANTAVFQSHGRRTAEEHRDHMGWYLARGIGGDYSGTVHGVRYIEHGAPKTDHLRNFIDQLDYQLLSTELSPKALSRLHSFRLKQRVTRISEKTVRKMVDDWWFQVRIIDP